ncbi:MAG: hypothetical protein KatS3mg029_0797 [Saprospiraceae bacterium]|nr:MAG: hypothetical protein KatS3mg029_0797 [Saprospiraceae bacterium]
MKLHLLLAFLLALPSSWLQAQKADRLFEKMAYYEAIEKFLERPVQDLATMERLAHAYRLNHDTRNAEIWYARIVEQTDDPLNYLYYAQMLECNGNHAAARQWLERYASETGHRGPLPMPLEMDAGVESVLVRPASALNSPWSEYAPAWFSDGLVFASTRPSAGVERLLVPHADGWTGDDFSKLLFSKINPDGSLAEPRPFESHFDTRLHEGPACFFNNDSVALALITANAPARRGGKSRLSILLSELKGAHWSTPKALDLGAQDCNDAHPTLSADGRILIFASDRPGGYGGMDLYGCVWREDRYCLPINLGPQINSAGNEVFPFLHPDGTLYFASDGRGGSAGSMCFSPAPPANWSSTRPSTAAAPSTALATTSASYSTCPACTASSARPAKAVREKTTSTKCSSPTPSPCNALPCLRWSSKSSTKLPASPWKAPASWPCAKPQSSATKAPPQPP